MGLNYVVIRRHFWTEGALTRAYATARRSSLLEGAFLLVADYLVTAAISSLSAFQYLGVPYPEAVPAGAIALIGALNYFGPRHTGGLAFLIAVPTVAVVAYATLTRF